MLEIPLPAVISKRNFAMKLLHSDFMQIILS